MFDKIPYYVHLARWVMAARERKDAIERHYEARSLCKSPKEIAALKKQILAMCYGLDVLEIGKRSRI